MLPSKPFHSLALRGKPFLPVNFYRITDKKSYQLSENFHICQFAKLINKSEVTLVLHDTTSSWKQLSIVWHRAAEQQPK